MVYDEDEVLVAVVLEVFHRVPVAVRWYLRVDPPLVIVEVEVEANVFDLVVQIFAVNA